MPTKDNGIFGALSDLFLGEEILDVVPETPDLPALPPTKKGRKASDPNANESVATVIKPSAIKPGSGNADSTTDTEETG